MQQLLYVRTSSSLCSANIRSGDVLSGWWAFGQKSSQTTSCDVFATHTKTEQQRTRAKNYRPNQNNPDRVFWSSQPDRNTFCSCHCVERETKRWACGVKRFPVRKFDRKTETRPHEQTQSHTHTTTTSRTPQQVVFHCVHVMCTPS